MTKPVDDGPTAFRWMRALRLADDVTGTRLLVLLALGTYWTPTRRRVWPSQATLAAATGLSERAIRLHLVGAVEAGWLVREMRGHRLWSGESSSSVYSLSLPSTGTQVPVENVHNRHMGATQPARGRDTTGTPVPTRRIPPGDKNQGRDAFEIARALLRYPSLKVPSSRIMEADAELRQVLYSVGDGPSTMRALEVLATAGWRDDWPRRLRKPLEEQLAKIRSAERVEGVPNPFDYVDGQLIDTRTGERV